MKQLSLMSVLRFSTIAFYVIFGLFEPMSALRKPTQGSSLYGALSSGATQKAMLNFKNVHTMIDTPDSVEILTTKSAEEINNTHMQSHINRVDSIKAPDNSPADNSLDTSINREQKEAAPIPTESPTVVPKNSTALKQHESPIPSSLQIPGVSNTSMPAHNNKDELVEFQFEGTDLDNLVKQVALLYDVIFIPDDTISPLPAESKALKGNKVSFKTHRAMTKGQAWDIFISFLHLSGFVLTPDGPEHTYRITTLKNAQHNPLPTYISVNYKDLPDNDQLIRYVYFIENATTDTIKGLLEHFKSPDALVQILNDAKAFVITDRSYNIKVLINIIKELDKASMPQELLVLKLRLVEAQHVKELYESLVQSEDKSGYQRFFPPRKTPTSLYFPENVRIIAEKRTNTLIVLGPKDALKVLEDFIVKHVDVDLDQPYSKITIHKLRYADASTIAGIMNNVTKLGANTEAGKVGGLRGTDKLVRLNFVAEPETNSLLINGDYEDYLLIKPSIEDLDQQQPQVAIEILLLAVEASQAKQLGAQIRTREPALGFLGNNVKVQTNALDSFIVENPSGGGATRLLGDLLSLVTNTNPGTSFGAPNRTVLSLGSDKYGVWGIFRALEQINDAHIISNPFITTSNKTPATIKVGETRRIVSSQISNVSGGGPTYSFTNDSADLLIKITPQINSDGMISLQINIDISEFTTPPSDINAIKVARQITTNAIIANKEILALGGLINNTSLKSNTKVPVLGDIPVLGWLFKDRSNQERKSTLLVLISTQIINPKSKEDSDELRKTRTDNLSQTLHEIDSQLSIKDPIDKTFFNGRLQDPNDRFFAEYIDRKFGVKQYKEIAKNIKKEPKKNTRSLAKKSAQIKNVQPIQEVVI